MDYLLTGVQPAAVVQRSWQDDESDGWGISVLVTTGAAARIPAVVIVPSPTSDTYVDQIDVMAYPAADINSAAISGQLVSLFTPEGGYNPVGTNGANPGAITTTPIPGLFNSRSLIAPNTQFLGGYATSFQPPGFNAATYQLDAVYNPAFITWWPTAFCNITVGTAPCAINGGQVTQGPATLIANQAGYFLAKMTRIWEQQSPPLRIPANEAMAIQLGVIPSVSYVLLCTLLFHEQNAEQL